MKIKKVLKMSASWCMPCKVYSITFNDVKNEEKYKDVVFEEIDVEENEEFADKYNIRAVPTTVVLDEKKIFEIGTLVMSEIEEEFYE